MNRLLRRKNRDTEKRGIWMKSPSVVKDHEFKKNERI